MKTFVAVMRDKRIFVQNGQTIQDAFGNVKDIDYFLHAEKSIVCGQKDLLNDNKIDVNALYAIDIDQTFILGKVTPLQDEFISIIGNKYDTMYELINDVNNLIK